MQAAATVINRCFIVSEMRGVVCTLSLNVNMRLCANGMKKELYFKRKRERGTAVGMYIKPNSAIRPPEQLCFRSVCHSAIK